MGTEIISNGSKWAGQAPDTVEQLLTVLATQPLDSTFEDYGNFITRSRIGRTVSYFGNFRNVSHVFNIRTDDPSVIRRLSRAIRANQRRPDYGRGPLSR